MTKSEAARQLKAANPTMNACQIARMVGMDRSHAYDALARPCRPRPERKPYVPTAPRKAKDGRKVCALLPMHHADAIMDEARRTGRQRADVIREAVREWYARRARPAGSLLSLSSETGQHGPGPRSHAAVGGPGSATQECSA